MGPSLRQSANRLVVCHKWYARLPGLPRVFAALALTIFAGAEGSGANAQVAAQAATQNATEAPLTEEVVPVFVEKAVVQELPEPVEAQAEILDSEPQAGSLRELVTSLPAAGELSEELHCLAGAVYFESRGEPLDGQLAVAQVIVNRAEDRRFPSSYCGVVFPAFAILIRERRQHAAHPHRLGRMEACEGYRADRASWPVGQPGE